LANETAGSISVADIHETGIYRAMAEEGGMPQLGSSASTLGIRRGRDITADQAGVVNRPAFKPGGRNGLSCAPTIGALPRFALPLAWGGQNHKTVVWKIEESDLPPELVAEDDSFSPQDQHVSIGPAKTMGYDEFVLAIEVTRPHWRKVAKG
jgi:hypothetical protein